MPGSEESETEKLSGIVSKIICHNQDVNRFSAYRIGYLWVLEHRLLQEADELVLADDSCYGPVFPFERAFEEMKEIRGDRLLALHSGEELLKL